MLRDLATEHRVAGQRNRTSCMPSSQIGHAQADKLDLKQFVTLIRVFTRVLPMPAKIARKRRDMPAEAAGSSRQLNLGWLGGTIGFNLRVAQEASVQTYLRSVADAGTLAWRFAMLEFIDLNPGLTQAALAKAIMRDTSSLTPALDDLCKRGLVTRIRPDHDRRSYELRITPRGRVAIGELKTKVQAHERDLDRLFTREQRSQLIEMLRQIARSLDD